MVIPYAATGPALIFVGFLMIGGLTEIDFSDFTEAFGPFMMIVFGAFTASIGAGIIAHIIIKVFTGKAKEIHPGLYILCIPMVLYFIYNQGPSFMSKKSPAGIEHSMTCPGGSLLFPFDSRSQRIFSVCLRPRFMLKDAVRMRKVFNISFHC